MALFGFGKKKETPAPAPVAPKPAPAPKAEPPKPAPDPDSPEALYRKGMDLRGLGRYSAAFPTLLLAAGKGHGEAMLECARMYQRGEGIGKNLKLALGLAEKAAAQNVPGASGAKAEIAAQFLLEDGGKPAAKAPENPKPAPVQAPVKSSPAPAAQAEPQPGDDLTPEERYTKGMELFKAGDYDGAFPLLKRACPFIGSRKDKYPDGQAAMGWMYENGQGTEAKDSTAHIHYKIAARNGNRDGMAGMVRLTAKIENPSVSECQTALDYAKQLGTEETKSLLSTVERKLVEAQKREKIDEMIKDFRKLSDIERENLAGDWFNMTLSQKFAYKKVLGQMLEDLSRVVDDSETQEKLRWIAQGALLYEERYYGALKSFKTLSKGEQAKWIEDILGRKLSVDEQKNSDLEKLFIAGYLSRG